jgi:SPP1 family predicted phage head-tail adaptor
MPFSTSVDGVVPTQLRGIAWLALSQSGTILNLAGTTDSGGGATRTWTGSGTVDCRVDAMGGAEAEVADRIADRSTHLITVPPETTIGHEDRFASDGITYEVTAVRDSTREWVRTIEAVKTS